MLLNAVENGTVAHHFKNEIKPVKTDIVAHRIARRFGGAGLTSIFDHQKRVKKVSILATQHAGYAGRTFTLRSTAVVFRQVDETIAFEIDASFKIVFLLFQRYAEIEDTQNEVGDDQTNANKLQR